ncbi:hypothetical protein O6H91_11G021500 [Diphasiastrum complanatum]|uniref:Uncharacterized protein n=5 Tax=Diphasiastrum complanatum TaxID=34168 RepID=A0ACC2C6Z5_DIPCM|nr:hypothetical protein O6H91_11G021500 [Diphasiastrum complanatum]KAJ7537764.1 hypothetical protein O6H91_11G021500 [Diphasiastrum complanatum]KAJ7537765.1 hypothetical protein O6H91_11G021500 [Diphasiastrum complanatum]KAJ7537766.1 hypothetical protein O6H91_11G021500 [Diphasiastrum complanatum]KAJ7537767.1 hypothetical protein O6H91_11G021500 [Diphasiastrum complanatum]
MAERAAQKEMEQDGSSSKLGVTHGLWPQQPQEEHDDASAEKGRHDRCDPVAGEKVIEGGLVSCGWTPRMGAFQSYSLVQQRKLQQQKFAIGGASMRHSSALRLVVSKPIVARLTRLLMETYQLCNPSFTYLDSFNKRRVLTHPSEGVSNNGLDNSHSDLILAVNGVLVHPSSNQRYIVKDLLGQGTFGQVVKCWTDEADSFVAVKVIKNQPAYYHQALVEISILTMLNMKFDPGDKHHIVRITDHFYFQGHLCIVFELLAVNLFELLKVNQYRGISLHLLQLFTKQIVDALVVLQDASVIHCDLKPENILLASLQSGEIKLIDFGSACMENRPVYSYIQSRFYRSPEVVLGHPYTTAIDMWSLGCIAAELFLGVPLFPGESEYDLLRRMIETLGVQPPDHMLRGSKNTSKYFKHASAAPPLDGKRLSDMQPAYQFLSEKEYEGREKKKPLLGKHHHKYSKLEDIILNYPLRSRSSLEDIAKEHCSRLAFIDFLRGLVQVDPGKRWTPNQAALHPFVTNEPFTGPFKPPSETPRTPACQEMAVKHNPGSGHWFGAGLSPQVTLYSGLQYHSPQGRAPLSYASSYESYSSFGSCEDIALGSSYGSYGGDATTMYQNCNTPPAGAFRGQMQGASGLGLSPDMWQRVAPMPPNGLPIGCAAIGVSPSGNGFKPMSLGGSPSQFTPPGQFFSPGSPSQLSPSRYGPTSPARGGGQNPLGKAAAVGQYNKRRGWGTVMLGLTHDGVYPHRRFPQVKNPVCSIDVSSGYLDGAGRGNCLASPHSPSMQGSPCMVHWRQRNGLVSGSAVPFPGQKVQSLYAPGSLGALLASQEALPDGSDDVLPPPDPRDWDPNYSGEDFLQDDNSTVDAQERGPTGVMGSGGARLGPGPGPGSALFPGQGPWFGPGAGVQQEITSHQHQDSMSSYQTLPRISGQIQGQINSVNFVDENQSPNSFQYGSQQDHLRNTMSGYHDPFSPQQTFPSRLGQQSFQQRQQRQSQHHLHPQIHQSSEANPVFSPSGHGHFNMAVRGNQVLGILPSGQRLNLPPHPRGTVLNARSVLESGGNSASKCVARFDGPALDASFCVVTDISQLPHATSKASSELADEPSSWLALSSAQAYLEAEAQTKMKRW